MEKGERERRKTDLGREVAIGEVVSGSELTGPSLSHSVEDKVSSVDVTVSLMPTAWNDKERQSQNRVRKVRIIER
jgi:hypothetical protein